MGLARRDRFVKRYRPLERPTRHDSRYASVERAADSRNTESWRLDHYRGGLVFIASAMDNYLRAFDIDSGEEMWKERLPAGGQATPITYRLGRDRRQYVVIAAGGHGKLGTKLGDSVVAFALP
jgi:hypothetical protein